MLSKYSSHELHPHTANDPQSRNGYSACGNVLMKNWMLATVRRAEVGACLWRQSGVAWEGQDKEAQWLIPGRNEGEVEGFKLGKRLCRHC